PCAYRSDALRRCRRARRWSAAAGSLASGQRARAETKGDRTMGGLIAKTLKNVREGRMQRLLAAATAFSAPPLAFEIFFEHEKGSWGDKWMWTPIVLTPPLTAAGIAGFVSPKAARTVLPLFGALYALDGVVGVVTHFQGVRK